jgi:hypothetical protein
MLNSKIDSDLNKTLLGQFYTTTDPFKGSTAFAHWWAHVPQGETILEPFAGAGHLLSYINAPWAAFDIDPQHPDVVYRDTLADFPREYRTCITNPPYLAKNAISRKKLDKKVKYEDLYLDCLEKCLEHCDYVAAIVPSTFWGTTKFRDRLFAWDKIDHQIFSDTLNPAGVGYWVPDTVEKTKIFVNGSPLAFDTSLWAPERVNLEITFNDAEGNLVLDAIDTTKRHNIKIKSIEGFDRDKFLKGTSRNYSLIKCSHLTANDYGPINELIQEWREQTSDFYLTSFKSMMKQGKYRKRIGFNQFKWLVHKHLRKENRI